MVYHGFKFVFGRDAEWDTPWIDFAAWARAIGMPGVRITRPGEITAAMLDRLTAPGLPGGARHPDRSRRAHPRRRAERSAAAHVDAS